MENGNGSLRQHINSIHWNMGAKQWQKKRLEIKAVILQLSPDIFIITEDILKMDLKVEEKEIGGYTMLLPLSAEAHGLAIIVMLIREGVESETTVTVYGSSSCSHLDKDCSCRQKTHDSLQDLQGAYICLPGLTQVLTASRLKYGLSLLNAGRGWQ